MSRIRANKITNQLADGSPTVEKGLVISGVTTSTTFSGSGASLTNLPAANLTGTLPAISGANLTGVLSNIVEDTSPQLGGTLDTNNQDITFNGAQNVSWDSSLADFIFNDYAKINLGTDKDFKMYQAGNNTILQSANTSGGVYLQGSLVQVGSETGEPGVKYVKDNQVELYFDNNKKIETTNTGAVVTGILTATSFSGSGANLTSLRANRNLIINGDCSVCQYRGNAGIANGTGILTVDRFNLGYSGHDEELTQEHRNNGITNAPSKLGISHSFQVKNGNQTSTGSSDYARITYTIESQYMRNSGWDFQNSNSYVTLSFWCKSTVSKNFYGQVFCQDSPFMQRSFETGTLTANTWTKVEIPIPGNSSINFDHNEGPGFIITWYLYAPTSYTSGNGPLNTWMSYNASKRVPADSDAWWTADNATFDLTGVQLEVGNVATPFELKNYDQNLWECKRYFQRSTDQAYGSNYTLQTSSWHSADGVQSFCKHNNYYDFKQNFEREMRVNPTLTIYGSTNQGDIHIERVAVGSQEVDWNNNTTEVQTKGFLLRHIEDSYGTSGTGNGFGILAYTADAEF